MPRISDLSQEEWKQVEILAVAGMTYKQLGEKFNVEPGTIAVRAHREEWAVPARVEKLRKELTESQLSQTNPTGEVGYVKESNAGVQMAESIAEMGQKGALGVVKGLLPKLLQTFQPDSTLLQKDVNDWKSASSMFGIFAKASGLDKPQQAVQVNVWQQSDERE